MNSNFDQKFQELLSEMIAIAFEYVDNNVTEVDAVYVIGLIEQGYFYKQFYKINNELVKSHKVNSVSAKQYDTSRERAFGVLHLGVEILEKIKELFVADSREVPTMLKLIYFPKTKKFESEFSYDYTHSKSATKTAQDVYEEWFNIISNS